MASSSSCPKKICLDRQKLLTLRLRSLEILSFDTGLLGPFLQVGLSDFQAVSKDRFHKLWILQKTESHFLLPSSTDYKSLLFFMNPFMIGIFALCSLVC